mmetsp:Transcript_7675/g.19542  ORF Transcript_7675/g.19542 Transcript_7675/m.19542 type:complete len:260 (+) Transcript_7675:928-1707(+)
MLLVRGPVAGDRHVAQAPAAGGRLPVGGGGRHEDAGLQRQPAVGLRVRRAGHRRHRPGRRVQRLPAGGSPVPARQPGGRRLPGAAERLVPPHQQGRVAVQHARPWLAHLRLLLRGPQGGAGAGGAGVQPRRAPCEPGAAAGLRQRHPIVPKRRRWVGHVREHAQLQVGGDHQPGGDVRGHHDRLPLRGVLLRLAPGPGQVPPAAPPAPRRRDHTLHAARPGLPSFDSARRRQLVRQLGHLLHLRHVVWRQGSDRHGVQL